MATSTLRLKQARLKQARLKVLQKLNKCIKNPKGKNQMIIFSEAKYTKKKKNKRK